MCSPGLHFLLLLTQDSLDGQRRDTRARLGVPEDMMGSTQPLLSSHDWQRGSRVPHDSPLEGDLLNVIKHGGMGMEYSCQPMQAYPAHFVYIVSNSMASTP